MSVTGQQTRRNSDSAPARRVPPADRGPGAAKSSGQAKMPPGRTWLWFGLVLLANFLLMRLFMPSPDAPVTVPYTVFKEEVGKGNVKAIYSRGETITGRFAAPVTYPPADEKKCGAPRRASAVRGQSTWGSRARRTSSPVAACVFSSSAESDAGASESVAK